MPATRPRLLTRYGCSAPTPICGSDSDARGARASSGILPCGRAPSGCDASSRRHMPERRRAPTLRSIGYVLKGYPRLSELFIASEIRRLERLGVPLRVYVIKRSDESIRHAIIDEIEARPEYLPAAGSVSSIALWRWLAGYFGGGAARLPRVAPPPAPWGRSAGARPPGPGIP